MNAKDAHTRTVSINNTRNELNRRLKVYFEGIEKAVNSGEFYCNFDNIPDDIQAELKKLGYSVRQFTRYSSGSYGENEYYYVVGW